ncbi:unnamed protein product [Urochloa humidicola]
MAAIRSALAMLGRRSCGYSGSEAAASFRTAVPKMPPPLSLRPAGHSLESYRPLFTGGRVPADKAENWWQRFMYRIKNADTEEKSRIWLLFSMIVLGSSTCCALKKRKAMRLIH